MRELSGRVAVVTGAARGIGRSLAERLGAEGMKVVLADAVESNLTQAVNDLRETGVDAMGVVTDVSDPVAVDELGRKVLDAYGAVHLVCNNAGVHVGSARSWEGELDDWRWALDVNFWGVLHGVRTFTPLLLEQDLGHIVNTASMAGLRPFPGGATYCVSKSSIVTLTETLYHEVKATGRNVGVSLVCPGATNTEGWRRAHTIGRTMAARDQPGEDPGEADVDLGGVSEVDAPATVVAAMVNAVLEDRFYVFPQPAMKAGVRDRMERLLHDQPPALPAITMPSAS